MSSSASTTHAAPADQPTSVHQITDRLFPAYTIDGGSVHLAGCCLEDRVFLRLEFCQGGRREEIYVDQEGRPVEPDLVEALGMTATIRLARPPESKEPELSRAIQGGTRLAEERFSGSERPELAATTVLWCKFARGKLRFTVGQRAAELAFSGWARRIEPPPFVCPYTGQSTFHIAATDDGRIVAAERIETCAETGRRLLSDDLVTCAATGRRVAGELAVTCPVTGDRVLASRMVRCGTCRQSVSPTAVQGRQCAACRQLRPVDQADPRVARLLDKHPPLARWQKWRLSETAEAYILATADWRKRLLVVVDKSSLELKLVATGSRFLPGWQVVEPERYETVLCP